MKGTVQIVFCMDTEGPCDDPGNPQLLATWDRVETAMDKLFTPEFRRKYPDKTGGHFKIGWFFLTWTGFKTNPRGRDMGYHKIRDHYIARWGSLLDAYGDEHGWHYHHPAQSGIGNEWGLDWTICREYEQIISRQILERNWFPACYRAGGTIMDPISSRWVDAWFPFDYTNRAPLHLPSLVDWRPGVSEWTVYHPDHEDFRKPGAGKRRMARCLDLVTNISILSDTDIETAFKRAQNGQNAILSCFDHDYRDIAGRIHQFLARVQSISKHYPDITYHYAGPVEAMRRYHQVPAQPHLEIDAMCISNTLHIHASQPIFQSIPWIAVCTRSGEVCHIECDIHRIDAQRWIWHIDQNLDWAEIGIAGSTDMGMSDVAHLHAETAQTPTILNRTFQTHPKRPHSIWEYSKYYLNLCISRASGQAEEMDSVKQAVALLSPHLEPGMTVLDVGCAAGHAWHSFRKLGIKYFGIDASERAIEIGRNHLAQYGLSPDCLRPLAIEKLPSEETYDIIVCLNVLSYMPMFHLPLEIMARAADKWLVIRSGFDTETQHTRFLPDVWLEPGFQTKRAYFNIYSKNDIQAFLKKEGFKVTWHIDQRQLKKFGGKPEMITNIALPAEFLLAERIAPRPSDEDIWGPQLTPLAHQWLEEKKKQIDTSQ